MRCSDTPLEITDKNSPYIANPDIATTSDHSPQLQSEQQAEPNYPTAIVRQRVAWRAHKRKIIREKHELARLAKQQATIADQPKPPSLAAPTRLDPLFSRINNLALSIYQFGKNIIRN